MVLGPGVLGVVLRGRLGTMSRKELIAIVAAILTTGSALFGAMSYVEARFVDRDELSGYMTQILTRLQSIEEKLRVP